MDPVNGAARVGRRWVLAVRIAARSAWRFRCRAWMAVLLLALPSVVLVAVSTTQWTLTSTPALVQLWLGRDPVVQAQVDAVSAGPLTQDLVGSTSTGDGLGSGDRIDVGALDAALPEGDTLVPVDVLYGATLTAAPTPARPFAGDGTQAGAVVMQTSDTRVPTVEVSPRGSLAAGESLVPEAVMTRTGTRVGDSLEVRVRLVVGDETSTVGATVRIVGGTGGSSAVVVGSGTLDIDRSRVWDRASTTWYVLGGTGLGPSEVEDLNSHGFLVTSRLLAARASSPADLHPEGVAVTLPSGDDLSSLTRWPGSLLFVVVLAELVALAGPVVTVAQRWEAANLAALSAVGGDAGDRRRVVVAWGTVVGLAAGVLSVPLGVVAALLFCRLVEDVAVLHVPPAVLVWAVSGAVGLGVLVSLWPAREAARMDVVAVLSGRAPRGSPMVSRRWWTLLVLVAGFAVQVLAAVGEDPRLFVVGAALVLLGLPQWTAGALRLSGRVRPGVPLVWGLAMRDAVRAGHRTLPALVSVVWIVFLASSSLVWCTARDRVDWLSSAHLGSVGQVLVAVTDRSDRDLTPALASSALSAVDEGPGVASTVVLRGALTTGDLGGVLQTVSALVPPARQCPLTAAAGPDGHVEDWTSLEEDVRCWPMEHSIPTLDPSTASGLSLAYVVDDGTYLEAAGLADGDDGAEALATLRAGGVLVTDPRAVVDGRATVQAMTTTVRDPSGGDSVSSEDRGVPRLSEELSLPAATWQHLGVMVVSPRAAERLGLAARPLATLVTALHPTGVLSAERVSEELEGAAPGTSVTVIAPDAQTVLVPVGIVVGGVLVVLLAVAMVLALADGPTRRGLRFLSDVGASPGQLRRLVLSQGLVVVVHALPTGLVAGVATGLLGARCTLHPTSVLTVGAGAQLPVAALAALVGASALGALVVAEAFVARPRRNR